MLLDFHVRICYTVPSEEDIMTVPKLIVIILPAVLLFLGWAAYTYKCVMWPKIMKIGSGPIHVSCVGDSITFGLGVLMHRKQWSYQAFLAEILGEEYTFFNYGLTNRTLLPVGNDYYFKGEIGKIAWNTKADILIFMLGSNDSKQILWDEAKFEKEYMDVIAHYKQMQCFRQIYIMIPPKVFNDRPAKRGCNTFTIEKNAAPIIRRVAAACEVKLIDLYALTSGHREWFPDKLHPNKEGNRAIAEEIAKHIQADSVTRLA